MRHGFSARRTGMIRPLALASLVAMLAAAPAAAQDIDATVDVQASAGIATNPFLVSGGDTSSAYGSITVTPALTRTDERGAVSLVGHYTRMEYVRRYDGTDGYGAALAAHRSLSPLVDVHANLVFDSSILGQGRVGTIAVVDPTPPPDLGTPDITLLGLRQRQTSFVTALGANWKLSERDVVGTDGTISVVNYGGGTLLNSSRTYNAIVSYARTISPRTSIGATASGSWVDYKRRDSSGSYYQPQLTLTRQLSETLNFSLAAGLLFITSTTDGLTQKTTGFSGSFSGCQQGQRGTACLRAYSDAQATGLGGISKRIGTSVDYSYVLAEHDLIRASAEYSRISQTSTALFIPNASYVGGGLNYEHGFSRTWFGGGSVNYRRATNGGLSNHTSDANFMLFVRTRLGDTK
jgi:hypothetical protein